MRVVVGLGNPGPRYAENRHNVGFKVVEELAYRWRWTLDRGDLGVRFAKGMIAGQPTILAEPVMYMNRSGWALRRLVSCIEGRQLLVIHDDLDLPPGMVRVKRDGGTGGHRGLSSIVEYYGSDFTRVRVGIGRPPGDTDAAAYVLSNFGGAESALMGVALQCAADAVERVLHDGEAAAMNSFNGRRPGDQLTLAVPTGKTQKGKE